MAAHHGSQGQRCKMVASAELAIGSEEQLRLRAQFGKKESCGRAERANKRRTQLSFCRGPPPKFCSDSLFMLRFSGKG